MPHSNFADVLQIAQDGQELLVDGPLAFDDDDTDIVSVVVSAFVTQAPAEHTGAHAVGVTCVGSFQTAGSEETVTETPRWHFPADARGGAFVEGWAFGSAEMTYQASNGELEKYIWSQWVWLRRRVSEERASAARAPADAARPRSTTTRARRCCTRCRRTSCTRTSHPPARCSRCGSRGRTRRGAGSPTSRASMKTAARQFEELHAFRATATAGHRLRRRRALGLGLRAPARAAAPLARRPGVPRGRRRAATSATTRPRTGRRPTARASTRLILVGSHSEQLTERKVREVLAELGCVGDGARERDRPHADERERRRDRALRVRRRAQPAAVRRAGSRAGARARGYGAVEPARTARAACSCPMPVRTTRTASAATSSTGRLRADVRAFS